MTDARCTEILRSALVTARNLIGDEYEGLLRFACPGGLNENEWPDRTLIDSETKPLMLRYERALKKIDAALGREHTLKPVGFR